MPATKSPPSKRSAIPGASAATRTSPMTFEPATTVMTVVRFDAWAPQKSPTPKKAAAASEKRAAMERRA